jgi:carboxyl-terminal processing protease
MSQFSSTPNPGQPGGHVSPLEADGAAVEDSRGPADEPAITSATDAPTVGTGDITDVAGGVHRAGRPRNVAPSRVGLILVAILAGSALFMGGFSLGAHVATTPGTPADQETRFGPFWDVYSLIQSKYAGSPQPSPDQLVQAAINGMMQSLNDPWSYYQGPVDFQNSLLDVGGQALGIGVQVQLQPADPTATSTTCTTIGNGCELAIALPIPGSPAESAGILAGDVIVSVDGKSLDGMTIDQTTALIKGPKGTAVTLGIDRSGTSLQIKIVRNIYNRPEVTSRTLANGAVAYIDVNGVNEPAWTQFRDSLAKAVAAGQKNIILDLRGNLGGYVQDAVHIASQFIGSGTIVYQQDASGTEQQITADPNGLATDPSFHVVVLVDGNTASSAEILAGALQSRGRAKLVGAKTYGKGVVQEWLPLPNNFGGIHLTIARWLTPDKVWIQGKGLKPDVPVSSDGARAGTDPVLDAGLQQLGFPPEPIASPSPAGAGPGLSPSPNASLSPSPNVSPGPSQSPSPSPS